MGNSFTAKCRGVTGPGLAEAHPHTGSAPAGPGLQHDLPRVVHRLLPGQLPGQAQPHAGPGPVVVVVFKETQVYITATGALTEI